MEHYERISLMQHYTRLLAEDKDKIKKISSLQLARDIKNFFTPGLYSSVSGRREASLGNTTALYEFYGKKDKDGRFGGTFFWIHSNNAEFYNIRMVEGEEFLFYDKVEELSSQVFEAMSDTQKFEVLENLFKKQELYLNQYSYFMWCLKQVCQTSPKAVEDFMCKVLDEFVECKDWCENLSEKEMGNVILSFKSMMPVLNAKGTSRVFHRMLESNQDNLHKQELIFREFKKALEIAYASDNGYHYYDYKPDETPYFKPSYLCQSNLTLLENKKYNRTLFEFFKYDNSQQMIAKINPILAETFAPYAISKRDASEIASFFKMVAMSAIDVGPTDRRDRSRIQCSDYTVDLFKFLMDENRTDALDAICSIENIEEIFPLFSMKGFIFQDYMESSKKIRNQEEIKQQNRVKKNETPNETKVTRNPKEKEEREL